MLPIMGACPALSRGSDRGHRSGLDRIRKPAMRGNCSAPLPSAQCIDRSEGKGSTAVRVMAFTCHRIRPKMMTVVAIMAGLL